MAGEWKDISVGEFAPFVYGKSLTERRRDPSGDVPVYGSNGIVGYHTEALTCGPAVIIGRKGTVGAVHFSTKACWPIDTTFFIEDEDLLLLRFKYYLLKSLGLEHMNADSAVPGLNRDAAHARIIQIPPPSIQQAIACILGTLDDKIELNRRMNKTLEEMAQAIFKSWFVDFDPVRAKAAVRSEHPNWSNEQVSRAACPNLKPEIAALFPDSFKDSELGMIPKGWKTPTVGKVCELAYGKALKAEHRRPGTVPVIGSNGQIGLHDHSLVKGPGVVVGRKGNPGIVSWIDVDFFAIDTAFYVVSLDTTTCPLTYLFYALRRIDLANLSADSAVPGLNRNIVCGSKLIVPNPPIASAFDKHVLAIKKRAFSNNIQSSTLAALRDTLLPKLISGKLRLPAALLERVSETKLKPAEHFLKESEP